MMLVIEPVLLPHGNACLSDMRYVPGKAGKVGSESD
jgi:hypothetical protein